jgi:L-ascorbate metabolism protein UlaG (beta-lactamase superfamily)
LIPATVTWLGHATALVELDGVRLLTDPALRKRMGPLVRTVPCPEPATFADIDVVLLSHLHADHADLPSLRMVGQSTRVIAPVDAGSWLAAQGFSNVEEMAAGARTGIRTLTIEATRATHDSRRKPLGPRADPIGFVVRGSRSIYFAGDTDLFPEMAALAGGLDAALLPVWGWGASLGPGHLDPARAAAAAELVAAKAAIPIHWGTYALAAPFRMTQGRRPPRRWAPDLFASLVERQAATQALVLEPGSQIELGRAGMPPTADAGLSRIRTPTSLSPGAAGERVGRISD